MIEFTAPRPGVWLRADIADILTALSVSTRQDATPDEVLCIVSKALGLRAREHQARMSVVIEAPGEAEAR